MPLAALAGWLNIGVDALEDYELGLTRIGPLRLFDLAEVLDVPIGFFFDSPPDARAVRAYDGVAALEPTREFSSPQTDAREAAELMEAFFGITDKGARRHILALMRNWQAACPAALARENVIEIEHWRARR